LLADFFGNVRGHEIQGFQQFVAWCVFWHGLVG
jgi:hypothetical protein